MKNSIKRGSYQEIVSPDSLLRGWRIVLSLGIEQGVLDAEYLQGMPGRGGCLSYDLYDHRGDLWIVQRRRVTFGVKYNTVEIDYLLISCRRRQISASAVTRKRLVKAAARRAVRLGDVIARLLTEKIKGGE